MNHTPTNNDRNPEYCDACEMKIVNDECECCNNGGWRWGAFHTPDSDEGE